MTTVEEKPRCSDSLYSVAGETVTALYASGRPAFKCPKDAIDFLSKKSPHHERSESMHDWLESAVTPEQLDALASCGGFPHRPSDLFLKVGVQSILRRKFHAYLSDLSWRSLFS